jgi:hypothetical protein
VLLACAAVLSACAHDVRILEEHRSPGGRRKAVVFTTRGGAELHTSVSVLRAGAKKPGWPPNAFTALHHDDGSPEEGRFGGPKVTVRWVDAETLEISYDARASTLRRHRDVNGVRVVYRVAEHGAHQVSGAAP